MSRITADTTTVAPILRMERIRKQFGPTVALAGVDFEVRPGEVHALIGENGAGKSTLMKILSGAVAPDAGRILFRGHPFRPDSPSAARHAGIAMVYQELTLAPDLTVLQNIALGRERSSGGVLRSMRAEYAALMERLPGVRLDPDARVADIGIGARQMTEIARALLCNAALVVFDEPTSSLSRTEVDTLFAVIRRLAAGGVAVVYISHFLEEVLEVADRYTVLRDGRTVCTGVSVGVCVEDLVRLMVGRTVAELYIRAPEPGGPPTCRLALEHAENLDPVPALTLRRGEVLGIAGLVGSGRTELLKSMFGSHRRVRGQLELNVGRAAPALDLARLNPQQALAAGIGFLPEDRKAEGLASDCSLADNQTLAFMSRFRRGIALNLQRRRVEVEEWLGRTRVVYRSSDDPVNALSGGNQQKILLGRLLQHDLNLLLLDEPTRGVDVGAKVEIYRLIRDAAAQGAVVIVATSYLPELFGISHSIAVMHRGRLSPVRPVDQCTPDSVMRYAATGAFT